MTLDLGTALGLVAAALYLTSYGMKSMLPSRALAVASNVFFIAYGYVQSSLPELVQNPKLGFYFIRLIVERLLRDIKRGGVFAPATL